VVLKLKQVSSAPRSKSLLTIASFCPPRNHTLRAQNGGSTSEHDPQLDLRGPDFQNWISTFPPIMRDSRRVRLIREWTLQRMLMRIDESIRMAAAPGGCC